MSIAKQIKQAIKKQPAGKPFTNRNFHHLGSTENVRKVLTRLVNTGEINRVARGIFTQSKKATSNRKILPTAEDIAKVVSESKGEKVAIHGAEAARQLRLSTQVPMQVVFYTSGNTRKIKFQNKTIILKHISPRKLAAAGTIVGLVISALWYLGRNTVTQKTIHKIKKILPEKEYQKVLQGMEYMPAWMANLFHQYEQGQLREGRISSASKRA